MNESTRQIITRKSLKKHRENRQAIMERAFKKAIDNGWLKNPVKKFDVVYYRYANMNEDMKLYVEYEDGSGFIGNCSEIIYRRDFAKALWPRERFTHPVYVDLSSDYDCGIHLHTFELTEPESDYRLQQMVIDRDPIRYIGENI